MTRLKDHFLIRNYEEARSFDDVMITGKNYRITILSEVLVRLEYSKEGKFEDRPTELVTCRRFNSPKFFIKNEKEYLTISTNYFKLEYQKEKPFYGTKLAPDINLRITLNNSDKIWFFGCAEARNFNGTSYSLDDVDTSIRLLTEQAISASVFLYLCKISVILAHNALLLLTSYSLLSKIVQSKSSFCLKYFKLKSVSSTCIHK